MQVRVKLGFAVLAGIAIGVGSAAAESQSTHQGGKGGGAGKVSMSNAKKPGKPSNATDVTTKQSQPVPLPRANPAPVQPMPARPAKIDAITIKQGTR